ncbi:DUF305 domain-containing protein [Actinopolymorpha rutila]|uniref:Uncharacterized protein (DUF305 family) n=1 Tax=Actinopolymorpha rutila TaxID=446787 RepID=A0A852ZTT6_9ACTN|nr:uncharacterized protein (DUF305 family) [Actinopolymorpha rutila]
MGAARNVVHKSANSAARTAARKVVRGTTPRTYSVVAVAALIGIAALLTGCGGGKSTPAQPAGVTAPAGKHNAQDVEFTEEMVEHHQEVVAMSALAAKKATNAQVKSLAAKIKAAHAPKIAELSAWLKAWGEPVPTMGATPHMTRSPSPGKPSASHSPGMMTDEHELSDLQHASGKAFDKMYVEAMIHQYSEAVDIAKVEQTKGLYPPAKKLAAEIVANHPAEIAKMQALLKKL